jgi:intracellular sulfur oxidation DsrE/DsrF family protein
MPRFTASLISAFAISACFAVQASAGEPAFHEGAVFTDFGKIASVEADMAIPKRAKFKVLFDTSKGADAGSVNRTLNSAARFINMHAEAGVSEKNMKVAIVFHSKGSFDLTRDDYYSEKYDGAQNGNTAIIKALTEQGVRIILCGQTAAYYDITKSDLLPGVEMALSAMTAHALLQQQGYTLNPF